MGESLLTTPPYKISISLHAPSANEAFSNDGYLVSCVDFAKKVALRGCFVALRLWNLGTDTDNSQVLDFLHKSFPGEWKSRRGDASQRLSTKIFLEWGEHFEWPDENAPDVPASTDIFCHALRDQIGILCDGTVVPCCLDAEGTLALGNLFDTPLTDILQDKRARAIYDGFTNRRAAEDLCRRCDYARRFRK